MWHPDKYQTVAVIDGLKYEVVDTGEVCLFGKPIFQACTLGTEMVPQTVRRTLGTFGSRADALARVNQEIAAVSSKSDSKEV